MLYLFHTFHILEMNMNILTIWCHFLILFILLILEKVKLETLFFGSLSKYGFRVLSCSKKMGSRLNKMFSATNKVAPAHLIWRTSIMQIWKLETHQLDLNKSFERRTLCQRAGPDRWQPRDFFWGPSTVFLFLPTYDFSSPLKYL